MMMNRSMKLLATSLGVLTAAKDLNQPQLGLPERRLYQANDEVETFEYDLSTYSVRFEKCQLVKSYDDDFAQDEDSDSPLATKHFVVYRLCPPDACDSCDEHYGTYVAEVDQYLASTIENQQKVLEDMCDNCDEQCNDNGEECSGCAKTCTSYQNLEQNGFIDASEYIECQELEMGDDAVGALYIGPMCASSGQKIIIGLFSDENCWEPYTDLDVEDVLEAKLSYHLLSHASSTNSSVCLSCLESDEDQNENDQADADAVNEMCENLYFQSAKCETPTGLEGGFIQTNLQDQNYENQVENEMMACTFINSLLWNSYTETGEIDIYHKQDVVIYKTTTLQKLSISILSLTLAGLMAAVVYLQHRVGNQYKHSSFVTNPSGQLA